MIRSISAQIGQLAFAVAVLAGLSAGNPAYVILMRALWAAAAGLVLGHLVGWIAKGILREHLQHRKSRIDLAHIEALRAMTADEFAEGRPDGSAAEASE